ncbi:MAG: DUF1449 family protein [Rhodobacteraceae bacterium]|nr:DUF1449 family protein [Paracoccaceae bacterium]
MTEIFFNAQSYPFTLALVIVAGLFLLEIITLVLGGSFLSMEADAPDIDMDLDADFDIELDIDVDTDLAIAPSGLLGWIGIKDVPFMMWLVSFLTMFGLSGLVLQSAFTSLIGAPLPAVLAALIALPAGLFGAKFIARIIAAIMPKHESEAMRTRYLGGHHGTITQGVAKRGKPAEAKIQDRFGNFHYLRVEPLDDADVIPQGAAVHVIRRKDGMFFVVDIT